MVLVQAQTRIGAVVGEEPVGDDLDGEGPEKVESNQPNQAVPVLFFFRTAYPVPARRQLKVRRNHDAHRRSSQTSRGKGTSSSQTRNSSEVSEAAKTQMPMTAESV